MGKLRLIAYWFFEIAFWVMGIWFIASALGSLVAGLVAAQLETLPAVTIFTFTAIFAGATGLLALLAGPVVNRLMGQVE